MAGDGAARFHLLVRYDWKAGVGAERVAYHAAKICGLPSRVPNLLDARFGERRLGHPAATAEWDHCATLVFGSAEDYAAFGRSAVHDEVAAELLADLERIEFVGFTG
jgi:hypothetical protein